MTDKQVQKAVDYSKEQAIVDTVKKSVFPGATDAELMLYFHKCTTVGVHPLDGMISPVKYKQKDGTFKVSFITSIDLFRSRSNQPDFDGIDPAEYEGTLIITDSENNEFEVPEIAMVKVYRKEVSRPFVGIARWVEFYPGERKGHMWRDKPHLMLGKCAEAQARRQAYPQELHHLYTPEEMERTTAMLAGVSSSTKPAVNPDQIQAGDRSEPMPDVDQSQWVMPSDEDRKNKKLITEKQGRYLLVQCKKSHVNPNYVAKAANVQNIYWLSWDKRLKTNFDVMLNHVENKPNSFDKFSKEAEVARTAPPTPEPEGNQEMSYKEFENIITTYALQAGVNIDTELDKKFKIDQLEDVPPEQYGNVIDYFTSLAEETPGA